MRIVVKKSALEEFWKARFAPEDSDFEEDRSWKGVSTRTKLLEGKTVGQGNYVELPFPLESVGFNILAQQKRISFSYEFYFRDPKIVRNLSPTYAEIISRTKNTFCPTSDDLTGYILDAEGNCHADIISSREVKEVSRTISFGVFGSRIREYDSVKDLAMDVMELSALANSITLCCIEKYNSAHKTRRIDLPHIEIEMGLDISSSSD